MLAFAFLNPALLWLLPLVAVPIIIHLLNKRRFQRVKWAAMEFLLAALKRNRRRLQMQEWLLLLLRALAVLFLVLLVSRPQLAGNVFGAARTHHVLCLDDSLSMTQRAGARDVFADARDAAVALAAKLAEAKPGDVLSLLATTVPDKPFLSAQRVNTQVGARVREALGGSSHASDASGDLAATLAQARKLIADTPECSRGQITLFTDLRQVDWLSEDGKARADLLAALRQLDQNKEAVRIVALGGRDAENLAVAAVRAKDRVMVAGVPASFEIDVVNRGLAASAPGELTLRIGLDGQATQRTLPVESIAPGSSRTLTVQHTFRDEGDTVQPQGVAATLSRDSLAADDTRALALVVRPAIRCLLVDGDPGQRSEEAETFYLAVALDPDLEVVTGVAPTVVPDQALETEDLDGYDMVWLCNVPAPAPAQRDKLVRFVHGGGGLVIFTGNQVDPRRYNEVFGTGSNGLLPLPLADVQGDMAAPRPAFLTDDEHPLVVREAEGFKALFAGVLVGRFHASIEDPAVPLRPLVRVGDARGPALIVAHQAPGQAHGRVVVVGTTADEFWSSLPQSELFAPLCQEICAWAARAQDDAHGNLATRDVYRSTLDPDVFTADVTVRSAHDAAGERTFTAQAPTAGASSPQLELSVPMAELQGLGLFTLALARHVGGPQTRVLARNAPLREGELLRLTRTSLQTAYPKEIVEQLVIEDGAGSGSAQQEGGANLARACAIALVLALLLESLLAWRVSR